MPLLTKPESDEPEDPASRRPGSKARLLIVFVMASLALHAAALVALPGFVPGTGHDTSTRVLEVVMVQTESPPRIIDQQPMPQPQPQPQRRPPERAASSPPLPDLQRQAVVPAPVLALPEPPASMEPSFAVPAPKAA